MNHPVHFYIDPAFGTIPEGWAAFYVDQVNKVLAKNTTRRWVFARWEQTHPDYWPRNLNTPVLNLGEWTIHVLVRKDVKDGGGAGSTENDDAILDISFPSLELNNDRFFHILIHEFMHKFRGEDIYYRNKIKDPTLIEPFLDIDIEREDNYYSPDWRFDPMLVQQPVELCRLSNLHAAWINKNYKQPDNPPPSYNGKIFIVANTPVTLFAWEIEQTGSTDLCRLIQKGLGTHHELPWPRDSRDGYVSVLVKLYAKGYKPFAFYLTGLDLDEWMLYNSAYFVKRVDLVEDTSYLGLPDDFVFRNDEVIDLKPSEEIVIPIKIQPNTEEILKTLLAISTRTEAQLHRIEEKLYSIQEMNEKTYSKLDKLVGYATQYFPSL